MKKSLKFLALLLAAALLFSSCEGLWGSLGGGGLPGGGLLADPETPGIELKCERDISAHYGEDVTLSVEASVDDKGTLSYQWYSGTKDEFSKATKVAGATSATYKFSKNAEYEAYYWCEVTNSKNAKTSKNESYSVNVKISNVIVVNRSIDSPETWKAIYTYWVDSTHDVNAKLTIEPGTVIKFADDASLDAYYNGSIKAVGTAEKPIIFTSELDDDAGISLAPYISSGTGEPEAGYWEGLVSDGTTGSDFEYCEIRYAGSEYDGALFLDQKTTVKNCIFHDNTTPSGKKGALNISQEAIGSTVEDNIFYNNEWPLSCAAGFTVSPTNVFHKDVDGADPLKNEYQAIVLWNNDIKSTQTGTKAVSYGVTEIPYLADDNIIVFGKLIVGDGVIVRFQNGKYLEVYENATLEADAGCLFTSSLDDEHGGDIFDDGDDTAYAEDGAWDGIWIKDDNNWNNSINKGANVLYENTNYER